MFNTNEYFGGNVKSIAFAPDNQEATLGVMAPGEYEFGTSKKEFMTVVAGEMLVKLPNKENFEVIKCGETFIVEPNKKFNVKVSTDTAYICVYK